MSRLFAAIAVARCPRVTRQFRRDRCRLNWLQASAGDYSFTALWPASHIFPAQREIIRASAILQTDAQEEVR
jgi:hypothetical protein